MMMKRLLLLMMPTATQVHIDWIDSMMGYIPRAFWMYGSMSSFAAPIATTRDECGAVHWTCFWDGVSGEATTCTTMEELLAHGVVIKKPKHSRLCNGLSHVA